MPITNIKNEPRIFLIIESQVPLNVIPLDEVSYDDIPYKFSSDGTTTPLEYLLNPLTPKPQAYIFQALRFLLNHPEFNHNHYNHQVEQAMTQYLMKSECVNHPSYLGIIILSHNKGFHLKDKHGMTPLHHELVAKKYSNVISLLAEASVRLHDKITGGQYQGKSAFELIFEQQDNLFTSEYFIRNQYDGQTTRFLEKLFYKISKEGFEDEGQDLSSLEGVIAFFIPALVKIFTRSDRYCVNLILQSLVNSGFRLQFSGHNHDFYHRGGLRHRENALGWAFVTFQWARNPDEKVDYQNDSIYGSCPTIGARDENDNTILHVACQFLNEKAVEKVLACTSNTKRSQLLTVCNKKGETPLDIMAKKAKDLKIGLFKESSSTKSKTSVETKTTLEQKMAAEEDKMQGFGPAAKRRKMDEGASIDPLQEEKRKIINIINMLMNVIQPCIDHYTFERLELQFLSSPLMEAKGKENALFSSEAPLPIVKETFGYAHNFKNIGRRRNAMQVFACEEGTSYITEAYLRSQKSREIVFCSARRLMYTLHAACDFRMYHSLHRYSKELTTVYHENSSVFKKYFPAENELFKSLLSDSIIVSDYEDKALLKNLTMLLKLWNWTRIMNIDWADRPKFNEHELFISLTEKLNARWIDIEEIAKILKIEDTFVAWMKKQMASRNQEPLLIQAGATPVVDNNSSVAATALSLVAKTQVATPASGKLENRESKQKSELITQLYLYMHSSFNKLETDYLQKRCRELLQQGADIEAVDEYGLTPLHLSLIYNVPILHLLLGDNSWKSANIHAVVPQSNEESIRKFSGQNALQLIFTRKPVDIFPRYPSDITKQNGAMKREMIDAIFSQLQKEDFLDPKDNKPTYFLWNTIFNLLEKSSAELLKKWWGPLIRKYIPLQVTLTSWYGKKLDKTKVNAAGFDIYMIFEKIRTNDAGWYDGFNDLDCQYPKIGSTTAERKIEKKHYKGLRDEQGNSPLHVACIYGNTKAVSFLLNSSTSKTCGVEQLACLNFNNDTPLGIIESALDAFEKGEQSNKVIAGIDYKELRKIRNIFRNIIQLFSNRGAFHILREYGMNESLLCGEFFVFFNPFPITNAEFNILFGNKEGRCVLQQCYTRALNSQKIMMLSFRDQIARYYNNEIGIEFCNALTLPSAVKFTQESSYLKKYASLISKFRKATEYNPNPFIQPFANLIRWIGGIFNHKKLNIALSDPDYIEKIQNFCRQFNLKLRIQPLDEAKKDMGWNGQAKEWQRKRQNTSMVSMPENKPMPMDESEDSLLASSSSGSKSCAILPFKEGRDDELAPAKLAGFTEYAIDLLGEFNAGAAGLGLGAGSGSGAGSSAAGSGSGAGLAHDAGTSAFLGFSALGSLFSEGLASNPMFDDLDVEMPQAGSAAGAGSSR